MEKNNNQRIIFNLPEEITLVRVIDEILKNNGLEESNKEFFNKSIKGKEPRAIIIRDAAITIVEKRVSEKKIIELLAKHIETSQETAQKITEDIKQKLVPHAKIVPMGEQKIPSKISTQEIILEKIRRKMSEEKPPEKSQQGETPPGAKKIEVKDVDKNAEKLKQEREEIDKPGTVGEGLQHKGQTDRYREPIE